jgi:hypothetical protein
MESLYYTTSFKKKTGYRGNDANNVCWSYSILHKIDGRKSKLKFTGMEIKTMYLECLHMKFHLKELQKK